MKHKDPTDPHAWLARAKGNLNLAEKGGRLKEYCSKTYALTHNKRLKKHLKQCVWLRARIFLKPIRLYISWIF